MDARHLNLGSRLDASAGNPRYQVLTSQAMDSSAQQVYLRTQKPRHSSVFGANNFHNGGFTCKATLLATIGKLGRVFETSSYKSLAEIEPDEPPRDDDVRAWVQGQVGSDMEASLVSLHWKK